MSEPNELDDQPIAAGNPRVAGAGPLTGVRVLELFALGPVAHAATMLADLGAEVVLVARPGWLAGEVGGPDLTRRNRSVIEADLKTQQGLHRVTELLRDADVLLEGFRPGVLERLGLSPERVSELNPRLVLARMTGWGQHGPRATEAGHDINYLAITGHLHAIARAGERPIPPLNLVGDYGGGSMFCVVGILSALLERERSGLGQAVDAAMVDGASMLGQWVWAMRARGRWSDTPGTNMLDTGFPFYDTYQTADGGYMAVGALEPAFYRVFLEGLGLDEARLPAQNDPTGFPVLRAAFAVAFLSRSRSEWTDRFHGTDACVTPVLSYEEAAEDQHLRARGTIIRVAGLAQPAPAPRFSRSFTHSPEPPPRELRDSGWRPKA